MLPALQAVNREKSVVYFNPNVLPPLRAEIKKTLGILVEAFTECYLGLPTAVGRITSGSFSHIGERSRSKMQGWSEKNLSCAGREVLLKSVVQAIPTFSMSCFQLTKGVCSQLTSSMAKYCWRSDIDRRSLHWLSWKNLSVPKAEGGMGFRDFGLFNLALLGKHGWRLMTNPDSLCSRVLKGKYFHNCSFMDATAPRSASATWKAIISGRDALEQGLIKRVGDGESISIWTDRWIPNTATLKPMGRIGNEPINRVSELFDQDNGTWDVDLVRRNFLAPDADAILNIPLRVPGCEDYLAWDLERSGVYSVKTAYRALVTRKECLALEEGTIAESSMSDRPMWIALWKLKVIPRVRVFWWRVLRGILPDYATLQHRHIRTTAVCDLCKASVEDLRHALINCSHAKLFWAAARDFLGLKLPRLHPATWARDVLMDEIIQDQDRCKIIMVMHAIWSDRNRWTHDKVGYDPVQAVKTVRDDLLMLDITKPGRGVVGTQ